MRRCLTLAVCLALAVSARAVIPVCHSLLSLVEKLPDSLIFTEILIALQAQAANTVPPGQAERRLLLTAPDPEEHRFRACPRIFSPICSTDSRQYSNDCLAANHGAEVECRGPCPCGATASSSKQGPVDPAMGPCPKVYAPVCGQDGMTYQSWCFAGGEDKVACEGPCPCGQAGATRELLVADSSGGGQETKPCTEEYVPVCGTDNATYVNKCVAGAVEIACNGQCPCAAPLLCPTIWAPVCGADNKTYGSTCLASTAEIACEGECPCKTDGGSGGMDGDGNDIACFDLVLPVCGADGKTYSNLCFAQVAGVEVACSSECPCLDLIQALEGQGGLLLVPADEALANSTDATGEVLSDKALLKKLLARHVILVVSSGNLLDDPGQEELPQPSLDGNSVMTEAGKWLQLFGDSKGQPKSVGTGPPADEKVPVLASKKGCRLAVYQIAALLPGPQTPGT